MNQDKFTFTDFLRVLVGLATLGAVLWGGVSLFFGTSFEDEMRGWMLLLLSLALQGQACPAAPDRD